MKKMLLSICIMLLILSQGAFAAGDIKIIIDGQNEVFTPGPIIDNGSTLVPMRAFFETMGATVDWHDKTRSVTAERDSTSIELTIGSLEAYINGNKHYLSAKPQIIGDKTYVPLRFISEALGAQVDWNDSTRTISIKDKTKQALLPFKLIDTQSYELRNTFEFVNNGSTADLDLQILAGTTSASPYQADESVDITPQPYESVDITPQPYEITSDDYGNKYAKIKFQNVQPGQTVDVVVTKTLSNSGISYSIDPNNINADYSSLNGYNTYVSPQRLIESDNQLIVNKALSLMDVNRNPFLTAKNVYGFVNSYLTYDTSDQYAGKGALSGFLTGRGVCEEYSKLFVALLRADKIPARSVFGYWLQDDTKSKIGYDWADVSEYRHEWPEFYLPGYGWVIAEPTFNYTYNGIKTVPWDQFAGQKENGHILYGYEPDTNEEIVWSMRGYGSLNITYVGEKEEIRKAR